MVHGLSDAFERKRRYWFVHEQAKVSGTSAQSASVFRELAVRTGAGFCYPTPTKLLIEKLAPYLAETADLYEDAIAEPPKLVALQSVRTFTDGSHCWLRAEALKSELRRRGLGPASLTGRAARFGSDLDMSTPTNRLPPTNRLRRMPMAGRRSWFGFLS